MPQYWVAPFMADSSHVRYTVKGLNFHQTPCSLAKTPGCSGVPAVCCFMVSFSKECQPLINNPLGCLIGRVPFKYLIMAIDYWRSTPLINKPWFINPGLTLLYIYTHPLESGSYSTYQVILINPYQLCSYLLINPCKLELTNYIGVGL